MIAGLQANPIDESIAQRTANTQVFRGNCKALVIASLPIFVSLLGIIFKGYWKAMNRTTLRIREMASLLVALGALVFWPAVGSAGGVAKETFPRLGGYQIGRNPYAQSYGDPDYLRAIAKLDYAILGSNYMSINDHARVIRQINPNILLAKYSKVMSIHKEITGYPALKRDKAYAEAGPTASNTHDWWARDFDGNQVSNWPGNWTVNFTDYVQPDANGDRFPQWAAKLDYEYWFHDDVWDAQFGDSVYWKPRETANGAKVDWSGGQETNRKRLEAAFRNGHKNYWDELKRLAPEKLIFANHDWHRSEKANDGWNLPEYDQQIHGGLLERVMTSSDLIQERTPWATTRRYYFNSMEKYFQDPKIVMFVAQGEPDNYQFFRYAFATCLLHGGYFEYAPYDYHYGTVEWFDEFDLSGRSDTEWLGRAISDPPTSSWQHGVWRRDFEGGVALVNPKGNGRITVTIESGFRRIDGQQAPTVNNGKAAKTIHLDDGDGIILVRDGTVAFVADPKSPVLSVN